MHHPTPAQIAYMYEHEGASRVAWVAGVNAMCLVLAVVAVSLRLASRWKMGTKIGLDDWLVVGALGMLFGHVLCSFISVRYGMGRHRVVVHDLRSFFLSSLVGQTFYNLCIPTIKFSILCLYHRIFQVHTKSWFNPTLWITSLFIALVTIPQCFVHVFQCVPIDSLWNTYGPGYRVYCINFQAAIVAFGVINIVTDWFILVLPIPVVMSLSLERRTKWSICSLFLMGGIVCVVSIVRLFYSKRFESADPSWDYSTITTISSAECALGILAACMPTWRPLFKFLRSSASSYFGSAAVKSIKDPEEGRSRSTSGRFSGRFFSRQSRTPSPANDLRSMIDHRGMGTGIVRGLSLNKGRPVVQKRSDTAMSAYSTDKMLSRGTPSPDPSTRGVEMEMYSSPHHSPWTDRGNTASPTSPMPVLATAPSSLLPSMTESRSGYRGADQYLASQGFAQQDFTNLEEGFIDSKAMQEEAKLGRERWEAAVEAQRRSQMEGGSGERERSRSPKRGLGIEVQGSNKIRKVELGRD